jgi:hypothetical protein
MSNILNYAYTPDNYCTTPEILNKCIENVKNTINIKKTDDLIIDPSAGNGIFINGIKSLCNNFLAYDIYDTSEHNEIHRLNFLNFNSKNLKSYEKIHIIGFPPIGKQSLTCKKFIKKCSEFADTISFILPLSFKRDTVNKVFPKNFHLIFQQDITEMFQYKDKFVKFPSVFQIWERRKEFRKDTFVKTPDFIEYVTKKEKPHISILRVGKNAGEISRTYRDKNPNTHFFVKVNGVTIDNFIEKFKTIEFDKNNSMSLKSISKSEINKKITNLF